MFSTTFTELFLEHWRCLMNDANAIPVSSHDLSVADVVAVSRHLAQVELSPEATEAIARCSDIVLDKLRQGHVIYGVNTGFGGSADARSADTLGPAMAPATIPAIQKATFENDKANGDGDAKLINRRHTLSGGESLFLEAGTSHILEAASWANEVVVPKGESAAPSETINGPKKEAASRGRRAPHIILPLDNPMTATCMPESWARAAMLVRLNSLAGGASGIRVILADCLVDLLNKDVVPCIPLWGSISASGDLSPLSYVGAVMQGKPSAMAFSGSRTNTSEYEERRPTRADVALTNASISPITIAPKEGLAIVNETAVSAGVAALALHESMNLAALSQVLTAMSVEALTGSIDSFHPFIAKVRPHPGQVDSARNIYSFLSGSKLTTSHLTKNAGELAQDRYSIRTASQWIEPVLENLQLSFSQITIELNSVTDNPLIDTSEPGGHIHHGGNFQARAVTSATEKLRQDLQALGRMLFAQCTELINPATSRGLPPNLCAPRDGPGVDIMIAALVSELGFLANPVGTHVMTAEMGNQGLNSMALVSARYTLTAADVLAQMAVAHLIAPCQALDLRAMELLQMKGDDAMHATSDTTMLLGSASRRMYDFVRKELQVPFLDEAHVLAAAEDLAAGDESNAPSVGMYFTRVYESMKSGKLYEVVMECLSEVK
ncbi:L-Aspartase-like protein [Apiospora phragmitis]|uniref:L-Aspartase-like protein n=1 Tax=Apiospora phragmitis TaxID=2905665 RepID=A0ABR1T899_9PEZI